MRRTSVLVVGVASMSWDVFGLYLAVHRHAPVFAVAFGVLAVLSVVITLQA